MKHVCVAAKMVDDAKDGAAHIANMSKPADKVRRDFGSQPEGLARVFAPLTLPVFAIFAAARFAP